MKHIFIVNPVSGQTDAAKLMVPAIIEVCAKANVDYEVEITREPKHATKIVRQYIEKEKGRLRFYAVGGDGTLKEVFEGACFEDRAEVVSIPCGSGNDFVRNYGTCEEFLDIADAVNGTSIKIDLMEVNNEICASITSVGLDAEIAYAIPKYRRFPFVSGSMAYNISIIGRVLRPMGRKMRIIIDGKKAEGEFLIATVCNGKAYGGGYMAAPEASLQDGQLDIVLVEKIGRARIAGIIGKYKKGEHFKNGKIVDSMKDVIRYYPGKDVQVYPADGKPFILNMDGECFEAPHLIAKVLPLAANFVLPKKVYDRISAE